MAVLEYNLTLPGRVGNAPECDHWTYHHILPWRYYYLAGHALATVAKYTLLTNPRFLDGLARQGEGLIAALNGAVREGQGADGRSSGSALRRLFGPGHEGFGAGRNESSPRAEFTPLALIRLLTGLHSGVPNRIIRDRTLDPDSIAELCAAPPFGGFAGMTPDDRLDDPEGNPEPVRPRSFDPDHWGLLAKLRKLLEKYAGGIEAVPDGSDGRTLRVVLTEDVWTLLIPYLRDLTGSHNRVHPFTPADWDFRHDGVRKTPWVYLAEARREDDRDPVRRVRGSPVGQRFALNADGRGDVSDTAGQEAVGMVRGAGENQSRLYFLASVNADWAGGPRAGRGEGHQTTTPQVRPLSPSRR